MPKRKAPLDIDDDWPEKVIVDEKDLVWDDDLGYHRCPLGLIQTPRPILFCREWTPEGGLKLYVRQLEREDICDVAVVYEDDHEVCLRAVTCGYDHLRAKYPRIVTGAHKWYKLPPLNGRALIDAETDEEVCVERFADATRVDPGESNTERGAAGDPYLDIPF